MELLLSGRFCWILLLVGLAAGLPADPTYGAEPRSLSSSGDPSPRSWYMAQKDKTPSYPKEPQTGVSSTDGAGSGGFPGWSGVSGGGSATGSGSEWSGVSGGGSATGSGSAWSSVFGGGSAGSSGSGGASAGGSGVSGGASSGLGWSFYGGGSAGSSGSGFSTGGGPGVFAGADHLKVLQELSALGSNLMGSRQMVLGQAWNDDQHVPLGTVEKRPLYPSSHVVHYNSGYQRERDGRTDQKYVKDLFIQLPLSGSTSGGKGGAGPKGQQVQRG